MIFQNSWKVNLRWAWWENLNSFWGLQIKQHKDGIFICQEKYVKDIPEKECRGMIGSLLYLTTRRPDIVFAVGLCARFQTAPKESHYIAVKRIFRSKCRFMVQKGITFQSYDIVWCWLCRRQNRKKKHKWRMSTARRSFSQSLLLKTKYYSIIHHRGWIHFHCKVLLSALRKQNSHRPSIKWPQHYNDDKWMGMWTGYKIKTFSSLVLKW